MSLAKKVLGINEAKWNKNDIFTFSTADGAVTVESFNLESDDGGPVEYQALTHSGYAITEIEKSLDKVVKKTLSYIDGEAKKAAKKHKHTFTK